ncbi:arsenate reductase [Halocynthiibacter sp. C4]|uniref:ArsC/Spx/MgsR family protein n=1 Tax=Halocynthiibacter sp. C4 TaxID=2992758 RepID=UPI00237C182A|nr:ArsC/Spx/MgsR family protein [Halocynthiibacter sp. C4]MDE0590168.1 arsenate reductase [Halocynthiibacter sp. C4]
MRFWGLKNCDTCRRAAKELEAAGYDLERVDVRSDGVERGDLERFFEAFGDALVNRRSTTWRALDDAERAGDAIDLLVAHPTLMKRPVIEHDGALYLGYGADVKAALIR